MKKLFVTLTLIATLCSANLSHGAERYVTLLTIAGDTSIPTQIIAAGEVVTCELAHCSTHESAPNITVTIGSNIIYMGEINTYGSNSGNNSQGFYKWSIAGPCTVKLTGSTIRTYIVTLKIKPNPNIMGVKQ
jgi:hypothetical protein